MKLKVFLLSFVIWFGILGVTGTLFSGYHLTDDHDVLRIDKDVKHTSVSREVRFFFRDIVSAKMRFRPVHYLHRRLATVLFGTNFPAWSFYFGMLAVFTSFFLFLFARRIGLSYFESGLLVGLTLLGQQAAVWWKLGTNETLGMFFLSLTLLCMAKCDDSHSSGKKTLYNALFIILTVITSWCKESFILIIPALVAWKIWLTLQSNNDSDTKISLIAAFKKNLVSVIILLSVCLVELVYIVKIVGTTGIGYAGYTGFSIIPFINTLLQSITAVYAWVILIELLIIVIALFSPIGKKFKYTFLPINNQKNRTLLGAFLIAGLITGPQIILYMKSGMVERYLLPGIMGYTLFMVFLLRYTRETSGNHKLNKRFSKSIPEILVLSVLIIILLQQLRVTRYTALAFTREGKQVNAWFQSIRKNTQPEDLLLIITHPLKYLEDSLSVKTYLELCLARNNTLFSPGNLDVSPSMNPFWNNLNSEFFIRNPGFSLKDSTDREKITDILLFPGLENQFINASGSWFKPELFDRYTNDAGYVSYYKN